MPRPDRAVMRGRNLEQAAPAAPARPQRPARVGGPGEDVAAVVHTIDSTQKLLAQRIAILESNLQILSRTIVTHTKNIKELESTAGGGGSVSESKLSEIKMELLESMRGMASHETTGDVNMDLMHLRKEFDETKVLIDKLRSDIAEMKYVLDTINPVNYVTFDQVKEIVDSEVKKKR